MEISKDDITELSAAILLHRYTMYILHYTLTGSMKVLLLPDT